MTAVLSWTKRGTMARNHWIGWGLVAVLLLAPPAVAGEPVPLKVAGDTQAGQAFSARKPDIQARQKTPARDRTGDRRPVLNKPEDSKTIKGTAGAPDPGLIF